MEKKIKKIFMLIGILFLISFIYEIPVPGMKEESSVLTPGISPLILIQAAFTLMSGAFPFLASMSGKKRKAVIAGSAMILAAVQSVSHAYAGHADNLLCASGVMVLCSWTMILLSQLFRDGDAVLLTASVFARLPSRILAIGEETGPVWIVIVIVVMTAVLVYYSDGCMVLGDEKISISPSGVMPLVFSYYLIITVSGVVSFKSRFASTFALIVYIFLIIYFSFYFFPVTARVSVLSEKMKKTGIPGVKAGEEGAYVWNASRKAAAVGAAFLSGISVLLPDVLKAAGVSDPSVSIYLIIICGMLARHGKRKINTEKDGMVWPDLRTVTDRTVKTLSAAAAAFAVSAAGNSAGVMMLR